jgi:hypothetical protein
LRLGKIEAKPIVVDFGSFWPRSGPWRFWRGSSSDEIVGEAVEAQDTHAGEVVAEGQSEIIT